MRISRGVTALGVMLAMCGTALAQDKKKDPKAETALAAEFGPVYTVVNRAMSGEGGVQSAYGTYTYTVVQSEAEGAKVEPVAEGGYKIEFRHDFLKGQDNKIYVPFSVLVGKDGVAVPRLALVSRVVPKGATGPDPAAAPPAAADKDKKSKDNAESTAAARFKWDDALEVDLPAVGANVSSYRAIGALSIEPGTYDLYIAFRERASTPATPGGVKVGLLKQEFTVADVSEFSTSSVILTDKVDVLNEPLSPERQRENPYTLGVLKLLPSIDHSFTKTGELNMFFWIYGAGVDPATKKPNLVVEYNFHQKTADGEKFFNRTEPQVMNAETLPPTFDLAAGHQLTGSLAVPLASFPDGKYRLELKISDKTSGKTITRDAAFSVGAQ
jgi:hypothetical protein